MSASIVNIASLKVYDHPELGLTVHYGHEESEGDNPFVFQSLPESPSDQVADTELSFHARAHLYSGQHCRVFRGDLTAADGSIPPRDVVIKISLDNSVGLKREATMYSTKLRDLQGQAVPFYYGVYQDSGCDVTILVLQYCGEPLSTPFLETSTEFCLVIVDTIQMIHDAGVVHTNIRSENILVKDGLPIIVDFKRARPHVCHRVNAIVPGAVKPSLDDVGCLYIYRLVQEMCIWVPAIINFVNTCVAVEDIKSVEQLAEMAYSSSTDTEEDRRYILREARWTFDILSDHCLFNPDPQPPRGRSRSIRRLAA